MDSALALACDNYRLYVQRILNPAAESFNQSVSKNELELHHVFGTNLFVAHAVDYIQAIRKAAGIKENRAELVKAFDERFGVGGGRFRTKKFELIDGINNALKHIQLDDTRYTGLIQAYGTISFKCLVPDNGRVLCLLDGYRFDYSRVVLRPAIDALLGWAFEDPSEVLEFARGESRAESLSEFVDEDDPIDQMIAYCNPDCDDCGESESSCLCGKFVYDGSAGSFAPNFDVTFDFDGVMSRISGAYRRDG